MLEDRKKYNKILDSSTLTKEFLNGSNVNTFARYRKMKEYLINVRSSLKSTITMISLQKELIGKQQYGT